MGYAERMKEKSGRSSVFKIFVDLFDSGVEVLAERDGVLDLDTRDVDLQGQAGHRRLKRAAFFGVLVGEVS